ncbi:AMP-binding protein [Prauserella flavalba]|uniref:AMP-binding protein n=1 Tax=Prauserella flavalba TaxID=1477506 RepID=UPI0036F00678
MNAVPTVTELLLARTGDEHAGLRFADRAWTWAECVRRSAAHGALLRTLLRPGPPPHVGVLADNVPSFAFLLGGAALSGTVLAGLNPTRRGEALARDVRLADCQFVLAEAKYVPLLADVGVPVLDLDGPEWTELLAAHARAEPKPVPARPDDLLMLIYTSGTSGDPKAVRCTHGKIAFPGRMLAERFALSTADTVYVAMPMFHSNAIMAGWAVGLAAGATIALRRRFSASGFLPDVRRFGCRVVDAFGSTEGGVGFARTPDTPPGSLGRPTPGVEVLHPGTGAPCPPARFGADGTLLNAADAVGELVNTTGAGWFAGYYGDDAATEERLRDGRYHTGDLAYTDERGFCYFAGRHGDWLRVDGENLGTAPIERVLLRHPAVAEAAVYAVPGRVGDDVMAALVPEPGATLTPAEFGAFLAAQPDLGPKQLPRFVRIVDQLPRTATFKVVKRRLAAEGVDCSDPVWSRPNAAPMYETRPTRDESALP